LTTPCSVTAKQFIDLKLFVAIQGRLLPKQKAA
jgi:hypothetical protein